MNDHPLSQLMRGYDDLDNAIQLVETALPRQMSAAIEHLISQRAKFRMLLQFLTVEQMKAEARNP